MTYLRRRDERILEPAYMSREGSTGTTWWVANRGRKKLTKFVNGAIVGELGMERAGQVVCTDDTGGVQLPGGALQPAAPIISPSGLSASPYTITSSTSGANIRYVKDGSTPTGSSTLYSGAVPLNKSQWLFVNGQQNWQIVVGSGGPTAVWSGAYFSSVILSSNILELRVTNNEWAAGSIPTLNAKNVTLVYTSSVDISCNIFGDAGAGLVLLANQTILAAASPTSVTIPLSRVNNVSFRVDFNGVAAGTGTLRSIAIEQEIRAISTLTGAPNSAVTTATMTVT